MGGAICSSGNCAEESLPTERAGYDYLTSRADLYNSEMEGP